jgi:hypothetical protein
MMRASAIPKPRKLSVASRESGRNGRMTIELIDRAGESARQVKKVAIARINAAAHT